MENKIYCLTDQGDALFYIYLIDNPEECVMSLHCSIERQIISNKDTERMIRCIEERVVKEPFRTEFIHRLFSYIKKIPGINKYYL